MTTIAGRLRAKLVPYRAHITSRTDLTEALVEISCTSPATFEAGQVLALRVDGNGPGPTGTWRRYTIAEATGHEFRLIIQRNPDGAAAPLMNTVTTADTLTIRGPASPVLPSAGDGLLLIASDLTGLATIAALTHRTCSDEPTRRVAIAVFSRDADIDPSVIARVVGTTAQHVTVHARHEHIEAWIRSHRRDDDDDLRLLCVGEHGLTRTARRAAVASAIAPGRVRTHTYWKPGRRGLE